jgi:hypothetical protein
VHACQFRASISLALTRPWIARWQDLNAAASVSYGAEGDGGDEDEESEDGYSDNAPAAAAPAAAAALVLAAPGPTAVPPIAPSARDIINQPRLRRHAVQGDGTCSEHAIGAVLRVVEHSAPHKTSDAVLATPNDRLIACVLRKTVVEKTRNRDFECPEGYLEGKHALRRSFFGDNTSIAANAATLQVDVVSVDNTKLDATQALPYYTSGGRQESISVQAVLDRLAHPEATPLVVIQYNGTDHYDAAVYYDNEKPIPPPTSGAAWSLPQSVVEGVRQMRGDADPAEDATMVESEGGDAGGDGGSSGDALPEETVRLGDSHALACIPAHPSLSRSLSRAVPGPVYCMLAGRQCPERRCLRRGRCGRGRRRQWGHGGSGSSASEDRDVGGRQGCPVPTRSALRVLP